MNTGSGGMSLRPVVASRVTSTEVCNRGYKRTREGRSPKSLCVVCRVGLSCFPMA
jgi:hypothetical protein